MAEETISQNAAPQAANENPHLQDTGASNLAPNLDNELDAALTKSFEKQLSNEPKTNKETAKPEKAPEKEAKDKKPKEIAKPVVKSEAEVQKQEPIAENAPKEQEAWTALKNNNKRISKVLAEREEEITKLKTGLADKSSLSTKEIEKLRSEISELSKYRTMVDIQADPEFISKYDQPIEKAETSVKEMLRGMQVSDGVIDKIDFSNTKLMDDIINHVGEHRDKITARRLQRKVEEIVDLMEKRGETLSEQKTNYQQFMEEKKKESSLKGAEDEGRIFKRIEDIAAVKDQAGKNAFPFLNKIVPNEGASDADIEQANSHNKVVELMQQKLQSALAMKTPEERAELAVAAVTSHYLTAQLKSAMSKIKNLEEELSKISNVSTDTEKAKPSARRSNGQQVDVDSALSAHFSR